MATLVAPATLAAALAVALATHVAHAAPAPVCGSVEKRESLLSVAKDLLSGRDSLSTTLRAGAGIREAASPAVLVDHPATCRRAARAYYRYRLGPSLGGVAVARVGDRYLVLGDDRAGEWAILEVYTLAFEQVGRVGV